MELDECMQFGLFQDAKGIWRCGGHLQHADLPFATRHPIILPRDHHLTTLIVKVAHEQVYHSGTKETDESACQVLGGQGLFAGEETHSSMHSLSTSQWPTLSDSTSSAAACILCN